MVPAAGGAADRASTRCGLPSVPPKGEVPNLYFANSKFPAGDADNFNHMGMQDPAVPVWAAVNGEFMERCCSFSGVPLPYMPGAPACNRHIPNLPNSEGFCLQDSDVPPFTAKPVTAGGEHSQRVFPGAQNCLPMQLLAFPSTAMIYPTKDQCQEGCLPVDATDAAKELAQGDLYPTGASCCLICGVFGTRDWPRAPGILNAENGGKFAIPGFTHADADAVQMPKVAKIRSVLNHSAANEGGYDFCTAAKGVKGATVAANSAAERAACKAAKKA